MRVLMIDVGKTLATYSYRRGEARFVFVVVFGVNFGKESVCYVCSGK